MHEGDLIDGRFRLVSQREAPLRDVEIWDAVDTRLDTPARVWLTTDNPDALLRAGRQARRASSRHRHAAQIIALGPLDDGSAYVAQRVPAGASLARVLESREPLVAGRTAIAGALARALSVGPGHGWLTAADVVLTSDGPMVLGLALGGFAATRASDKASVPSSDSAAIASIVGLEVAAVDAARADASAAAQNALVASLATGWRTLPPAGLLDEADAENVAFDEAVRLAEEAAEAERLAAERAEELRQRAIERGDGDLAEWDAWTEELAEDEEHAAEEAAALPSLRIAFFEWLHRRLPNNGAVASLLERAKAPRRAWRFSAGPVLFLLAVALLSFAGYQAWLAFNAEWIPDWYTPAGPDPYPEFTYSPSVTPSPSAE